MKTGVINALLVISLIGLTGNLTRAADSVAKASAAKASTAQVAKKKVGDGWIAKGTLISVGHYQKATHAFPISVVKEPEHGPFSADAKQLAIAADLDGPRDILEKKPSKIEGGEVMLKSKLPLLNDEELKERKTKYGGKNFKTGDE